jgi:hypothetical protein
MTMKQAPSGFLTLEKAVEGFLLRLPLVFFGT